jgi:hypothetical protein
MLRLVFSLLKSDYGKGRSIRVVEKKIMKPPDETDARHTECTL